MWLLTSLYSHESTKGMRVKFQDVECFREYEYDFPDDDDATPSFGFNLWNPPSLDEIKNVEEKPKQREKTPEVIDDYTDGLAAELGLRSSKNQSRGSVEELDLSFWDYDTVDVDTNISPALTEKLNKSNLQNQSSNPANVQTSSGVLTFDNSSVGDATNQTLSESNTTTSNSSASHKENVSGYNTTDLLLAGNVPTEMPNLDSPLKGNSTVTLLSTAHRTDAHVKAALAEDSVEQLTRGDVFLYFSPSSNESATTFQSTPVKTIPLFSQNRLKKDNQTEERVLHRQNRQVPSSQLETVSPRDKNDSLNSTADVSYSLNVTNSSLENVTDVANVTVNLSVSTSEEDVPALVAKVNETSTVREANHHNPVPVSDLYLVGDEMTSSSQDLGTSDSGEEVVIYLKENRSHPIKSTSVKVKGHNWAYQGTHHTKPMEIADYLFKYLGKELPRPTSKPKRTKKVNLRHWPGKGQGLKTKRRKELKPQPRSGMPLSPRGFNPGMTPRGSRPQSMQPVSDEATLGNPPVVIGVLRPDFSDYEIYIPGSELDHSVPDDQNVKEDEYEYVSFKDPYSSHEDVKNFHLDDNTQRFLKNSGPNDRIYFIAAEEVVWDYGGYGQR